MVEWGLGIFPSPTQLLQSPNQIILFNLTFSHPLAVNSNAGCATA